MQYVDDKTLQLRKKLGDLIKKIREKQTGNSINRFANEYGLNDFSI